MNISLWGRPGTNTLSQVFGKPKDISFSQDAGKPYITTASGLSLGIVRAEVIIKAEGALSRTVLFGVARDLSIRV